MAFYTLAKSSKLIHRPELALVPRHSPATSIIAPRQSGIGPSEIVDKMGHDVRRSQLLSETEILLS